MYQYNWMPGDQIGSEVVSSMSDLYSHHYGIWGSRGLRPGEHIKVSGEMLRRRWLSQPSSRVVFARAFGMLVGYAIAVQFDTERGAITWVTQLVVHEEHRRSDVGKTMLFTLWQFTNHFAWGLVSANPFAVRALEKATRRRCSSATIAANSEVLLRRGTEVVSYVPSFDASKVNENESCVDTGFYLDHSELSQMLRAAEEKAPWVLGGLNEGWEWLAFTFREQQQIKLSDREIAEMLRASDTVTKQAFSRMNAEQAWMKNTESEVAFIIQNCSVAPGDSVLDFGCGSGRHAVALAKHGIATLGVDYVEEAILAATLRAQREEALAATFAVGDCRDVKLMDRFDAATCLYDVLGTYADDSDNLAILRNLAGHVKAGGHVLVSVMNMELTARIAHQRFSLRSNPDQLLALRPSNTMQLSGEVFKPEYCLIDEEAGLVYRKEQFSGGTGIPEELLVRDRRYRQSEIEDLCNKAGLSVLWSRFVRSGHWDEALSSDHDRAKEILVLCKVPDLQSEKLFV